MFSPVFTAQLLCHDFSCSSRCSADENCVVSKDKHMAGSVVTNMLQRGRIFTLVDSPTDIWEMNQ